MIVDSWFSTEELAGPRKDYAEVITKIVNGLIVPNINHERHRRGAYHGLKPLGYFLGLKMVRCRRLVSGHPQQVIRFKLCKRLCEELETSGLTKISVVENVGDILSVSFPKLMFSNRNHPLPQFLAVWEELLVQLALESD